MYYSVCPVCGASLDPEEKCDCQEGVERYLKELGKVIEIPEKKGEQVKFLLEGGKDNANDRGYNG